MLSNLQEIKDLVSIRAVADYLGLEEEYGKRKFPGERTASIQLYKDNRFHDFGRNVDGDIFDLRRTDENDISNGCSYNLYQRFYISKTV